MFKKLTAVSLICLITIGILAPLVSLNQSHALLSQFYEYYSASAGESITAITMTMTVPQTSHPKPSAANCYYPNNLEPPNFWPGLQDNRYLIQPSLDLGGLCADGTVVPYVLFTGIYDMQTQGMVQSHLNDIYISPGDTITLSIYKDGATWYMDGTDETTGQGFHVAVTVPFTTPGSFYWALEFQDVTTSWSFEDAVVFGTLTTTAAIYPDLYTISQRFHKISEGHVTTNSRGYPYVYVTRPTDSVRAVIFSDPRLITLLSPVNTAVSSNTPTFSWRGITLGESYALTVKRLDEPVWTTTLGSSASLMRPVITTTAPSGLFSAGNTYTWTVSASNGYATVEASSTFTIPSDQHRLLPYSYFGWSFQTSALFTEATAEFIVPTITPISSTSCIPSCNLGIWLALRDRSTAANFLQAGLAVTIDQSQGGTSIQYYTFMQAYLYSLFPFASAQLSGVTSGDLIQVRIWHDTIWHIRVEAAGKPNTAIERNMPVYFSFSALSSVQYLAENIPHAVLGVFPNLSGSSSMPYFIGYSGYQPVWISGSATTSAGVFDLYQMYTTRPLFISQYYNGYSQLLRNEKDANGFNYAYVSAPVPNPGQFAMMAVENPYPIIPQNGVDLPPPVTFIFRNATQAESYRFYMYDDSACSNLVFTKTIPSISTASGMLQFTLSSAPPEGYVFIQDHYYSWRLRAVHAGIEGSLSACQFFRDRPVPASPSLHDPVPYDSTILGFYTYDATPTLHWAITGLPAPVTAQNSGSITHQDMTPPARASETAFGYVIQNTGLDPNIKSLIVLLPKVDSESFMLGVLEWYDRSVDYTRLYGGYNLYQTYPITFRTTALGDENVIVEYSTIADVKCGFGSSPGAITCATMSTNSRGMWSKVTIYFDVYFQTIPGYTVEGRKLLLRSLTAHEFGHALGLGNFYGSPTCFGYSGSVMCDATGGSVGTIDVYAALLKWQGLQTNICRYGILDLPSGIPNTTLTPATDISYQLTLSNSTAATFKVLQLQSTSYVAPAGLLTKFSKYTWCVAAVNDVGASQLACNVFTILPTDSGGGMTAPTLVSPLNGAVNVGLTPELIWVGSRGASYYMVTLTHNTWIASYSTIGNLTSLTVPNGVLNASTGYSWTVTAYNGVGSVTQPVSWTFYTSVATSAPVLISPADGDGVAPPITFTWNAVVGADYYMIVITDTTSSSTISSYISSGLSWTTTSNETFVSSHVYRWTVYAHIPSTGWSTGSSRTFTISYDWRFSVTSSCPNPSIPQQSSTSCTITVAVVSGTQHAVKLGLSIFPSGPTAVLTPNTGTPPYTASLTLSSGSAGAQTYAVTLTGTPQAANSHEVTYTIQLTITGTPPPPVFDFSLALSPTSATVVQGQSGSTVLSATALSGTGVIYFIVGGQPAGGYTGILDVPTLSPNPSASTTYRFYTSTSCPAGTYNVVITGYSSGSTSRSVTLRLTVQAAPKFAVVVYTAPAGGSVIIGGASFVHASTAYLDSGTYSLSASLPGYNIQGWTTTGNVIASGWPSNTLYVSGAGSVTAIFATPALDFSLSVNPYTVSLVQGQTGATTIMATRLSGSGSISFIATGLPAGGFTGLFSPMPISPNPTAQSVYTMYTTTACPAGTYTVMVTGTGTGGTTKVVYFILVVSAATKYAVVVYTNPAGGTVTIGGSALSHGQTIMLDKGTYSIYASLPGYVFQTWTSTGLVTAYGWPSNTLSVAGAGSVTAYFALAAVMPPVPVLSVVKQQAYKFPSRCIADGVTVETKDLMHLPVPAAYSASACSDSCCAAMVRQREGAAFSHDLECSSHLQLLQHHRLSLDSSRIQ